MKEIQNPKLLFVKGFLFLIIGLGSSSLIYFLHPEWQIVVLLVLAIWGFCRAYYFAFYVIEKYIDPTFRFSGLIAFLLHLFRQKKS